VEFRFIPRRSHRAPTRDTNAYEGGANSTSATAPQAARGLADQQIAAAAFETLEARRLLAFSASINFQPAASSVPTGYLADTGAVYASRGNGLTYGWDQANSSVTRERNANPDQRFDTLIHTQLYGTRSWDLAVPNGQYQVHLVAGDPSYTDSVFKFNLEGALALSGTPTSGNRFVEATALVTVSDGKLSLTNASGATNNKICFIDVTSVATTQTSVSIAATDSAAAEPGAPSSTGAGTFKVTRIGSTASALTVNYTISGSAINGTDYNSIASSVVIPAGASFATITITPKTDSLVEGSENATLTLSSNANYTLGNSASTVTIADANIPTTGNWPTSFTLGPNNTRTRWESGAVTMDGKLWNFGGWMSASTVGTHDYAVYDPAANKWTDLGQAPIPVTHCIPTPDPAHHVIYLAGGLDGNYPGVPTNKVWKYDTLTNKWSDMPAMPEVHSSGGFALVNNQLHYIGGVEEEHDINVSRHIYLDLGNLAAGWQTAPDMPQARDHFSTAVIGNKIYCFGGEFGHDKGHDQQSLVHVYDAALKTWTQLANMPTPKSHNEAATFVTSSGKIIVAGGQIANFGVTDEVAQYDPATNQWSVIGKLPRAMEGPVVQQIGNQIIVTSGNPGSGPINTTWIGTLT
jgi:N-acetylneuraminic acid mutarotase